MKGDFHDRIDGFRRELLVEALQRSSYKSVDAADRLGISRNCFQRWARRLGVNLRKLPRLPKRVM